jgi:hypothetical protein
MTPVERWLYALACVLVPVAWGVVMVWATNRLDVVLGRRRGRLESNEDRSPPPLEYHI